MCVPAQVSQGLDARHRIADMMSHLSSCALLPQELRHLGNVLGAVVDPVTRSAHPLHVLVDGLDKTGGGNTGGSSYSAAECRTHFGTQCWGLLVVTHVSTVVGVPLHALGQRAAGNPSMHGEV